MKLGDQIGERIVIAMGPVRHFHDELEFGWGLTLLMDPTEHPTDCRYSTNCRYVIMWMRPGESDEGVIGQHYKLKGAFDDFNDAYDCYLKESQL